MKIAMFTETFHPQMNGVVSSLSWFAEELKRQGHSVEIFAPTPGERSYHGIPVHRFRSLTFYPYPEFRAALPPVRISRKLKRFDIAHTHGPFTLGLAGLYAAKRNKIPVVSTFHTPVSDYVHYILKGRLNRLGQKAAWSYSKRYYNRCDAVIVPSRTVGQLLRSQGVKAPIHVVPTGIRLSRFSKVKSSASVRKKFGLRGPFVLHTGRLSREKHVADIMKAAWLIDATIVVTSRGPELKRLKATAPKNVNFVGFVSDDDLVRLYKEATCSVIASEAETQGLVILEAMACGCPVVGADWLATPETVHHNKNGLLFRLHDARDMAHKVNMLLGDKKLRSRLSKNAKKTAAKSTIQARTRELVRLYRSLA